MPNYIPIYLKAVPWPLRPIFSHLVKYYPRYSIALDATNYPSCVLIDLVDNIISWILLVSGVAPCDDRETMGPLERSALEDDVPMQAFGFWYNLDWSSYGFLRHRKKVEAKTGSTLYVHKCLGEAFTPYDDQF